VEYRTFALKLAYDGTAYAGSQWQANANTIQAELERALATLGGCQGRVAFAGRTDAGVHATGQVAAVRVTAKWTAGSLARALNALLPEDIAVVGATAAAEGFDPRRQAVRRRYQYQVLNAPVRSPLVRRTAWHVWQPLGEGAIDDAAALLIGEHDFASFAGPVTPRGASTVRWMHRVEIERRGALLELTFEANAFLPHQVRRMVGALVEVGRRRLDVARFRSWLCDTQPGAAGLAAPAHGLCLIDVTYNEVAHDGVRFEVSKGL